MLGVQGEKASLKTLKDTWKKFDCTIRYDKVQEVIRRNIYKIVLLHNACKALRHHSYSSYNLLYFWVVWGHDVY